MAYASKRELPTPIRAMLPEAAQDVYIEVYNQIWHEHKESGESVVACSTAAHQLAWEAVIRAFVQIKGSDEHLQWYRRGEEPMAEEQRDEPGGLLARQVSSSRSGSLFIMNLFDSRKEDNK